MGFLNVLQSNYYSILYIVIISCCVPVLYFSFTDRKELGGLWFTNTTIALNIILLIAMIVSMYLFFTYPKELNKKLEVTQEHLENDDEKLEKMLDEEYSVETKQSVEKKDLFETEDEKKGKVKINNFDSKYLDEQEKDFNMRFKKGKPLMPVDKDLADAIYFTYKKKP